MPRFKEWVETQKGLVIVLDDGSVGVIAKDNEHWPFYKALLAEIPSSGTICCRDFSKEDKEKIDGAVD